MIGFNWIHHQIRIRSESEQYQQIREIRLDFAIPIGIIEHQPRLKIIFSQLLKSLRKRKPDLDTAS